jgi:hypothetical protein
MDQMGSIKTVYHFLADGWGGWHWRLGRVIFDLPYFELGGKILSRMDFRLLAPQRHNL